MRSALKLLSPAGRRGRLSVLLFHRVLAERDPLFPETVDARRFDEICTWLGAWFNVVALDDAARRLRSGTLPERALAITFDDGYADNHEVALPILRRHGFPATFFIATGFVDGGLMWNDVVIESIRRTALAAIRFDAPAGHCHALQMESLDKRRTAVDVLIGELKYLPMPQREDLARGLARQAKVNLPGDLMMNSTQVKAMRQAGMQVGAHTMSHPILASLDRDLAHREMAESKTFLERLIGEPVLAFAYPNGKPGTDFTAADVVLARRLGFEVAVSTASGAAGRDTDPLQLPRFTPWDRGRFRFGARMLGNLRAGQPN